MYVETYLKLEVHRRVLCICLTFPLLINKAVTINIAENDHINQNPNAQYEQNRDKLTWISDKMVVFCSIPPVLYNYLRRILSEKNMICPWFVSGIVQYTNMFPYTQVGNTTWHIITVPYFIAIAKPVTNNLLAKYNKTMK
jgi:hypothetical protein